MKKGILLGFACFVLSTQAHALTILKQVQVSPNKQIDLLFDQKVQANQIKVEYLRDIVQFSLKDISVYPAKIMSVSGEELKKIFAYQYTPNLVRFRMTIDGDAQDYKNRVTYRTQGKLLTINIEPKKVAKTPAVEKKAVVTKQLEDKVVLKSAQAEVVKKNEKLTTQENALLDEVIAKTDKRAEKSHLPSLKKVFGWMLALLGMFVFLVFTLKKLKKKDSTGFITKIFKKLPNSGFLGKTKLIEVVSNHYLGPKKSIAVVKVKGRMLLVGITNESINLISELDDNGLDLSGGVGAVAAGNPIFSQMLNKEIQSDAGVKPNQSSSVRDEIRRKVGSLKAF